MEQLSRDQLIAQWLSAIDDGTFVDEKHGPGSLAKPGVERTIFSAEWLPKIREFVASGDYVIREYEWTTRHPRSPYKYVLEPSHPTTPPASGVLEQATTPDRPVEHILCASGVFKGWHGYGHTKAEIQAQINGKHLYHRRDL